MGAIYRKEMRSYFINPIGYVYAGIFLLVSALLCTYTTLQSRSYNTVTYFTLLLFVLAVMVPILTMRTFAEEKRTGTEQTFLTAPVSLSSVVLGKFFAVLTLAGGGIVLSCVNLIPLYVMGAIDRAGEEYAVMHIGPVTPKILGCLLGLLLITAVFAAVGIFVSTLTENQLAAAVITIGALVLLLALSFLTAIGSDADGTRLVSSVALRTVIGWISPLSRFSAFTAGKIELASVFYFLSFASVFLFLSVRVYDRRRYA